MVVWPGYQSIIEFKDVMFGEEFASSKTGQHYRKIEGGEIQRVKDDRDTDIFELFEENDLVYRNPINSRAFY